MSMSMGSLQRAPWCRGLLVMKRHGAGVQVACVAGLICMVGQATKANSEGGAHMLRYLEARIATDVCVKAGVATRAVVAALTGCAQHVYPSLQARKRWKVRPCKLSAIIVQSS